MIRAIYNVPTTTIGCVAVIQQLLEDFYSALYLNSCGLYTVDVTGGGPDEAGLWLGSGGIRLVAL